MLSILILMQSCQIYKSSSLDNAVKESTKTKVFTTTGETFKFKKVTLNENGRYVGLQKKKGELKEYNLDERIIKEVKIKNKTASTIATIVLSLSVIGIVYLVIDSFSFSISSSSSY